MRESFFGVVSLSIVALSLFGSTAAAMTCPCRRETARGTLARAGAVFIGTATKVQFLEPSEKNFAKEPPIVVTFEVAEIWKGPMQKTLKLRTTYNSWTCGGYYFKEGQTYLVTPHQVTPASAGSPAEVAGVNTCDVHEMGRAAEFRAELGPGQRPGATASPGPR